MDHERYCILQKLKWIGWWQWKSIPCWGITDGDDGYTSFNPRDLKKIKLKGLCSV